VLPVWRIHRHIGMGGDQLVEALTDARTEHERGDDVRAAEAELYLELIDEVEPFDAAHGLIADLKERGCAVVLASSAKAEEIEHYIDLLDARDLADAWTTAADVEATKPEPDLVRAALDRAGSSADDAAMVGDTPWDVKAAAAAGVPTIAVRTGGFSIDELEGAAAAAVFRVDRGAPPPPRRDGVHQATVNAQSPMRAVVHRPGHAPAPDLVDVPAGRRSGCLRAGRS